MKEERGGNNKSRILYVKKILEDYTDEQGKTTVSIDGIVKILKENGIVASSRTIMRDINFLNEFLDRESQNFSGNSIVRVFVGKKVQYYLKARDFNFNEASLISDAVASAKFISQKDAERLVKKVQKLTNKKNRIRLSKRVTEVDRVRTTNTEVMTVVDHIYRAIADDRDMEFQYLEWTMRRKLEPRKKGELYTISPWAITWNDGNYYMIGYDSTRGEIRQYRIDKMGAVNVLEKSCRQGKKAFEAYHVSDVAKTTFNMFSGEKKLVQMRFHNSLIGVVFDRFGVEKTVNVPDGEDFFKTSREVAVSPQFFGWLAGFGDKATIIGPLEVAEEYVKFLKQTYLNQEMVLKGK